MWNDLYGIGTAYPKKDDPITPGVEFSEHLMLLGVKNRTGACNSVTMWGV